MSFFGSKKASDESKGARTATVIPTGQRIDDLVGALVENAADGNTKVRTAIGDSLRDVGFRHPNMTLSTCAAFIDAKKPSKGHRIILFKIMAHVIEQRDTEIRDDLGETMVRLCVRNMTASKEVDSELQEPSSKCLIALGNRFSGVALEVLVSMLSAGTVPHFFVVKTIGELANASPMQVVPKLHTVIARMIPVCAQVKQDNLRWVFAATTAHMCEGIATYFANIDRAPVKTLTIESFASELYPAYDVMFNQWLSSKESTARLAALQAVGHVCTLMEQQQFEAQYPKVHTVIMRMYAKEKEQLPITKTLVMLLEHVHKTDSPVLEPLLKEFLPAILPLACRPIDYDNPSKFRNSNELLRCFEVVVRIYATQTVHFLMQRLDAPNEEIRDGVLKLFKHLVTRNGEQMEDKRGTLVSGLKPMALNEKSLRVRKTLVELIIAMASHDYLKLEGGTVLVDFIVRQASTSEETIEKYADAAKKKKGAPAATEVSPLQLRNMCDTTLYLMASTIPEMEDVMYPYMLTYVPVADYANALAMVCKCLGFIAGVKREQQKGDTYYIDFAREVNLPQPFPLIARFFVTLCAPLARNQQGQHLLTLMRNFGPVLHQSVTSMWDSALTRLIAYVEKNADDWNQSAWEDLVLRLLTETIKAVSDDEWSKTLAQAFADQLPMYNKDATLKRCALRLFGLMLQKLPHKEYIRTQLEFMYTNTNHKVVEERRGCAQGFGYVAASHVDLVLDKIQEKMKAGAGQEKKDAEGGFFSSVFGDSKPKEADKSGGPMGKCTCVLGFGYVAAYAPVDLLMARIDVHIINYIRPLIGTAKSDELKEAIVKAVELIGKAVHPTHLKQEYKLNQRDEVLSQLLDYIAPPPGTGDGKKSKDDKGKDGGELSDKRKKDAHTSGKAMPKHQHTTAEFSLINETLGALATLIRLEPPLPGATEELLFQRLSPLFQASLVVGKKSKDSGGEKESRKKKESDDDKKKKGNSGGGGGGDDGDDDDDDDVVHSVEDAAEVNLMFDSMNTCFSSIFLMDPQISTLKRLLSVIERWTRSIDAPLRRQRGVASMLAILKKFVEVKAAATTETRKADRMFEGVGVVASVFVPRIFDPIKQIRKMAVEALLVTLYIDSFLRETIKTEDPGYRMTPPPQLKQFNAHGARMLEASVNEQYAIGQQIAATLCEIVADEEVMGLFGGLFTGLYDGENTSGCGTCVVLSVLVKQRGSQQEATVTTLIDGFLGAMDELAAEREQIMNGTLNCFRALASCFHIKSVDHLLTKPLPHTQHVRRAFQVLAKDDNLAMELINHLTNIINNTDVYDERPDKANKRKMIYLPVHRAMAATVTLGEILELKELEETVKDNYFLFVSSLLLRFGTAGPGERKTKTQKAARAADRAKKNKDFEVDRDKEKKEKDKSLKKIEKEKRITDPNNPMTQAVTTFKKFLPTAGDEEAVMRVMNADALSWPRFHSDDYYQNITMITAVVCAARADEMKSIFQFLQPYIRGNYVGHRLVTATVFAEFVNHAGHDSELLSDLLTTLLASLSDPLLKFQALRGLGNVVSNGIEHVNVYASTVLDALMSSIDDPDDEIAMEAMHGLAKVFGVVGEERVAPTLVNICHRIRPAFAKHNVEIRAAAFTLFGTLYRFGENNAASTAFYEQIHNYLPTIVIHINEPNERVRRSCKKALHALSPLLKGDDLVAFLEKALGNPDQQLHYDNFLNQLSKLLITYFPERTNHYVMSCVDHFRSDWEECKANSATFAGFLLGNFPVESRKLVHLNPGIISGGLIALLGENDANVREKAALAIALLHTY